MRRAAAARFQTRPRVLQLHGDRERARIGETGVPDGSCFADGISIAGGVFVTRVHDRHIATIARATVLATMLGCSGPSTSMSQTWSAPVEGRGAPMRSVLVLAAKMGETNRRAFEKAFVEGLADHGVDAKASHELVRGHSPDGEESRAAAKRANLDGILVVADEGAHGVVTSVPGAPSPYAGEFWGGGYYGPSTGMGTSSPGHVASADVATLELTLWDTRAGDEVLVWSAATHTTAPWRGTAFTKSVVDEVLSQIAEAGLIAPALR